MTKTGEFNLDFPGATLICDTEQKKEALKDYLNGKADVVDINFNDVASAIYNTTYTSVPLKRDDLNISY